MSNINGKFDPKNAHLLAIGEEDAPDFEGKWIWKLKILPEIQISLWKCLHHSLPVKGILRDRGIEGLGGCDSCPEDRESILHMLRECPIAQRFWCLAGCPLELFYSFSLDLDRWLLINANCFRLTVDKDYEWKNFFLFGIWNLWIQRNQKAFKAKPCNPDLLRFVEMQVCEFIYCVANSLEKNDMVSKEVK